MPLHRSSLRSVPTTLHCACTLRDASALPTSSLTPLALALALLFAGGAGAADQRSSPRPDGSILWSVDNCNDAGEGSLRDVAFHANHGDAIDLGGLACGTISVTTGAISLHDIELMGPGADRLVIDGLGNQSRRIFNHVSSGGPLTISGVTINGGIVATSGDASGGCLRSDVGSVHVIDTVFRNCVALNPVGQDGSALGGAIASFGPGVVELHHTTIESSFARTDHGFASGGGIYAEGDVNIYDSKISNNSISASSSANQGGFGGGVRTRGNIWIQESTFDGNASHRDAGAASAAKGGMLMRSTISNNSAIDGTAGLVMYGEDSSVATILSSTISGNVSQASEEWISGGLYLGTATSTIKNSTITANTETNTIPRMYGAGVIFGRHAVTVTMSSTIAIGNGFDDGELPFAQDDIYGPDTLTIQGDKNIVGWSHVHMPDDTHFTFDVPVGPLQNNGGPTRTHMPLPGSAAIDAGNANGEDTDQRGLQRVVGSQADIGAVESGGDFIMANGFEAP